MSPKHVVEEEVVLLSSTSCWKKGEHTKDFQCLFKTRSRRISFSGNRANAISNVFSGSLLHRKASIATTTVVSTISSTAAVANCLTISKLLYTSNPNHKACQSSLKKHLCELLLSTSLPFLMNNRLKNLLQPKQASMLQKSFSSHVLELSVCLLFALCLHTCAHYGNGIFPSLGRAQRLFVV
jgi:hypothetical protein